MEGLHLSTTRPTPTKGLDGENGFKRCLFPNPNPPRSPTSPEIRLVKFQCLPFGFSSAPQVFMKLLKPVEGFLRQIGLCLIVYLDNMLVIHTNKDQLEAMASLICKTFEALGLMMNKKKFLLNPTQVVGFLGFQINSLTMKFNLPSEKGRKIQQEATNLLKFQSISAQRLVVFIGKVIATPRAVIYVPTS